MDLVPSFSPKFPKLKDLEICLHPDWFSFLNTHYAHASIHSILLPNGRKATKVIKTFSPNLTFNSGKMGHFAMMGFRKKLGVIYPKKTIKSRVYSARGIQTGTFTFL